MTHVEDELNSQPECWARVAAEAVEHAGVLPAAGGAGGARRLWDVVLHWAGRRRAA